MNLSIRAVSKTFGSTRVLDTVSLEVPASSRTAIVGASGSGKSTLLRLIAGFTPPDAGRIVLGGRTIAEPGTTIPAHRRGIGYVAQDGALFPHLSVADNIGFGLPRAARRSRVAEVMELTSLAPALAARYPHEISGGQQQRVALARALAPRPAVILLDEPFSALDTGLRESTRRAVVEALETSGTTAVLVTHDQDEALSFGDGIGIMAAGRLIQSGRPSAVFENPVTPEIALFLGAAVLLPVSGARDPIASALGSLSIRHDRSGASAAWAMVRPSQIDCGFDGRQSNAVVLEVRPRGSYADVRMLTDTASALSPVDLTLPLPAHRVAGLAPGARVTLSVDGGAVLYPRNASVDGLTGQWATPRSS